jgi:hypothetical protein
MSERYVEKRMRYLRLRDKFVAILGSKCELCQFAGFFALEFHHYNGKLGKGRNRLNSENPASKQFDLTKVVLVCANCHKLIHFVSHFEFTTESCIVLVKYGYIEEKDISLYERFNQLINLLKRGSARRFQKMRLKIRFKLKNKLKKERKLEASSGLKRGKRLI